MRTSSGGLSLVSSQKRLSAPHSNQVVPSVAGRTGKEQSQISIWDGAAKGSDGHVRKPAGAASAGEHIVPLVLVAWVWSLEFLQNTH